MVHSGILGSQGAIGLALLQRYPAMEYWIGSNGIIFDPALHPIQQAVYWFGSGAVSGTAGYGIYSTQEEGLVVSLQKTDDALANGNWVVRMSPIVRVSGRLGGGRGIRSWGRGIR